MIILIACIDNNGIIGNSNRLAYRDKEDMEFFKSNTSGNYVVMGSNTYNEIGKPLNNRFNMVLSNRLSIDKLNCKTFLSTKDVLEYYYKNKKKGECLFVIGGANVYAQFIEMNLIDALFLNFIDKADCFEAPICFPFKIKRSINLNLNGIKYEKYTYTQKNHNTFIKYKKSVY